MGITEEITHTVCLRNVNAQGIPLQAIFLPEKGMNCLSYRCGEIEVIDQQTKPLFAERFAGLGALIGPHFHHRKVIPPVADESLFPHIARVRAKGVQEPFSHGIARYAPWQYEADATCLRGTLRGKDTWQKVPLAALEGQDFEMHFCASLEPSGLQITLSVASQTDSLVGLHTYYHLPNGKGLVQSVVQDTMIQEDKRVLIPSSLGYSAHQLCWEIDVAADLTFHPFPNPLQGAIALKTEGYSLHVQYESLTQENCWQLFHPAGATYVCIEPISAQDPRHPNLTASSLSVQIRIEPEERK